MSAVIVYNSLYKHGVDEKRRVQLPAKWRLEGADDRITLMVWRRGGKQGDCLLALPQDLLRLLMDKLKAMPFSDLKAEALRRVLGTKSEQVVVDRAGRFCLPEAMAKAAGIEKEVMLVGMFDRFQIWSPARYQTVEAADEDLLQEAISLI